MAMVPSEPGSSVAAHVRAEERLQFGCCQDPSQPLYHLLIIGNRLVGFGSGPLWVIRRIGEDKAPAFPAGRGETPVPLSA
jgi:hypothetical protein